MLQMHARWTPVLFLMLSVAPQALAEGDKGRSSPVQIVEPETLNGRHKLMDAQVEESLAAMERRVKDAIPGEETVVVARYGDPQAGDVVQILAVGRPTAEADRELNAMFQPLRDQGWTVSALEPVDPGPLGGIAKCAEVTTPSGGQSMCAWADAQSVGSVTFYPEKREEARREFVKIRELIERRR
jgi:hypothetical protein